MNKREKLHRKLILIVVIAAVVICIAGAGYYMMFAPTQHIVDYNQDSGYLSNFAFSYGQARNAQTGTVTSPIPLTGSLIGQSFQGGMYYIHRTVLFFDTSVLDEGEIVEAAYLSFTGNQPNNDFNIVVQRERILLNKPLEPTDYNLVNFEGNHGSVNTDDHSGFQFEIQLSGLEDIIDPEGFTVLILRSDRDIDGYQPSTYDVIHIENPSLRLEISNMPPLQPSEPQPVDGALLVDAENDLTLLWECSDPEGDPISYDVIFAETGELLTKLATVIEKTYTIPADLLDYDTNYQWQILASDAEFTTTGDLWTFKTAEEGEIPDPDPNPPEPPMLLVVGVSVAAIIACIGILWYIGKMKPPKK